MYCRWFLSRFQSPIDMVADSFVFLFNRNGCTLKKCMLTSIGNVRFVICMFLTCLSLHCLCYIFNQATIESYPNPFPFPSQLIKIRIRHEVLFIFKFAEWLRNQRKRFSSSRSLCFIKSYPPHPKKIFES